jgi:hypothetical protein
MRNKRPLGRTVRVHGWRLATVTCAAVLLCAIRRLKSRSKYGLAVANPRGTIASSGILPQQASQKFPGEGDRRGHVGGISNDVRIDNSTLISGGSGTTGVAASSPGAASVQSVPSKSKRAAWVIGFEAVKTAPSPTA